MPAKLLVASDIDNTQTEIMFDKPAITIGRKAGNDLHYNRPEISGNHAAFLNEGGQYYVQDLGSTNGTLLNGAPVIAKEKYPLQDQDLVTIAPYRITFLASRELSSTMLEGSMMKEMKDVATRANYEPVDKIATGTAEHAIPDLSNYPAPGAGTGTDPDIQPTHQTKPAAPAPPAPAPEPEPAPPEPPPQPKPAAAKPAAPAGAAPASAAPAEAADAEGPSSLPDFIWLAVGAIVLLAAIGLLVFIFVV